jgi:MFS family permease
MLSFNGPFVVKLGGSDALIGALSSLPALMIILFTLPGARLLARVPNRKAWVIGSLAASRLFYLLIALVPFLLPGQAGAVAIVVLSVLHAIPVAVFDTAFWTMVGEVCPPDRRSSLFATRTVFLSASMAVSAFASGLFLDLVPFPLNYQILNCAGFLLLQYSTYLVNRVEFPTPAARVRTGPPELRRRGLARHIPTWTDVRRFVANYRGYVNLNIGTLVCWFGAWGAGPLYTIYLVRLLHVSNSWLGTNSTLAQIAVVLSAPLWHRVISRKGDLWVVLRTVLFTGMYPLLIVLLPWSTPILMAGFASTLVDTGIGIAHTNVFLEVIPAERRPEFIAAHTTLMNVGAMIAPLLFTTVADGISVPIALLICGGLRFAGAALFWLLPPRSAPAPEPVPAPVAAR